MNDFLSFLIKFDALKCVTCYNYFFFFPERGERIKRLKNNHKRSKPYAKTTNVKDNIQDDQSTKLANTTQKQPKQH